MRRRRPRSVPGGNSNGLLPEHWGFEDHDFIDARLRIVTPGYIETLGLPIRGRDLSSSDVRGAQRVMVISEELARVGWGDDDPIGLRVGCCEGSAEDPMWKTVVGVVGDIRTQGLEIAPRPEFYMTAAQVPDEAWSWIRRTMTIVVRGEGEATAMIGAVREAVGTVAPGVPLFGVTTINSAIRQSSATARFHTTLLTILGAIGMLLAAGGIYAVISYFVSRRTHEIGGPDGARRRWFGHRAVDDPDGPATGARRTRDRGRVRRGCEPTARERAVRGTSRGSDDGHRGGGDPAGRGLAAVVLPSLRATRVDPARVLDAG